MEKSVELRLWRFRPAGLSGARVLSAGAAGLDGGGRDAEWEWETRTTAGLGGFWIVSPGRSA
jgi:hypothetical protein